VLGNFRIPYISIPSIQYTRQRRAVFSAHDQAVSSSTPPPVLDIQPQNRSIYLSRRGRHRNSEMTGRNDKVDARQDSSGSLIGKCVYMDGRTADINASDIIAIGHRFALPVKFAVRRAVSDSETICSLNCMRLHVARSLLKHCERLQRDLRACCRKFLVQLLPYSQKVSYIKIDVYEHRNYIYFSYYIYIENIVSLNLTSNYFHNVLNVDHFSLNKPCISRNTFILTTFVLILDNLVISPQG